VQTAFKEWAVIVDALGRGEQIIVLRKGGIHDKSGLFKPDSERFWLFPTLFHQQADSVIESAQRRFREKGNEGLSEENMAIQYLAEVSSSVEIQSAEALQRLSGQHIWRDDVIQERFDWGSQRSIYALLLRVYALPEPKVIDRLKSYGGCRSWIELAEDVPDQNMEPALSDDAFQKMTRMAQQAL
jgi:hypothetical protein